MKGTWDSIHVVEVKDQKKNARYKLTSTVMLSIETENEATGSVSLAGSLTRQVCSVFLASACVYSLQEEKDFPVNDQNPHVTNIGRMIEDMESKLRTTLELIYFGKTKEVVSNLRNIVGNAELEKRKNLSSQIGSALGNRG